MHRKWRRALELAFALCVVNIVAAIVTALVLGGTAHEGRTEDGHYYLGLHGQLTQVSASVYNYSEWHYYIVCVTFPLSMLCGFLLSTRWLRQ